MSVTYNISNTEFITTLFGADAPWCHVTDFPYDPSNIPKDRHLAAWRGDYFSRYRMGTDTNQYFTISCFYADEKGEARRRKALFRHTSVIVLDDVKEKLSLDAAMRLPPPTWVLETSPGSEQWGYILDTPCTDRGRVENLLDGLVANGLAPDGRDPGMKGVTRYVRLPEGINNKASKLVNGQPFKCRMLTWSPFNRTSLEDLARPFCVDLDAPRREQRVDGAADIGDHPLVNIPEILTIKEVRSDGRFDITCPWVSEHTHGDDSGSAIFTNADGSIGFKCHHGGCQHRTGADLLRYIEQEYQGFGAQLRNWQIMREFAAEATVSFMDATPLAPIPPIPQPIDAPVLAPAVVPDAMQLLCDNLRRQLPGTQEQRDSATKVLKHIDSMPKMEQKHWHGIVMDIMRWSKVDFKEILGDLRQVWYGEKVSKAEFYDSVVFVKELNQFYDWDSRIFFSTEAFQNAYSHEDAEARKIALQDGRVQKVDRLDYAPKQPRIFVERGIRTANLWSEASQSFGEPGDASRWFMHFEALGWQAHRKHVEQWMAYTLKHPDKKINHILLMGSKEGCGKDFLLYPLITAMGDNCTVIDGEELLNPFNDYALSTKYLHINETELGDRREAMAISNKLKPLAAAPPEQLRVNQKGIKPIKVRNILNATMTTNSLMPMRLNGPSRRFYAMWSDLNTRDRNGNPRVEWLEYWEDRWSWMKNGGWKAVVHYLINQVDLSDFNPQAVPPMTEFLRDIQEDSKSHAQQTLEAFIRKRHGMFKCDILTAADMAETLRAGALFPGDMMADPRVFTDNKVGILLREIGTFPQVRCAHARLWIIRNDEAYMGLNAADLYRRYEAQMKEARSSQGLQAVSNG